jgi:hypothetical protein
MSVAELDEAPGAVGSFRQVGGHEGEGEGCDRRGEGRKVDVRGLVVGGVGVGGGQPAGAVDPPGACFGGGEVLESAQDEAAGEFVVA